MTILSKLNLTDKTKAAMLASPEARGRQKILEALDNQIAAAKADAVAFLAIVTMMQRRYDKIEAHNVVIEYRHIGLGFAGNPVGPDVDPLVTVKLRDMEFNFITPGLAGIFTLNLPDFAASLTGEDHVTI